MSTIGTVESLWRYPVKSMCGEELGELFASYAGVYGDRLFAFESSAGRKGFPFFTGREQRQMIRYQPAIDDPALIDHLRTNIDEKHQLTLRRSDKAMTDCRPLSIFAVQSAKKLGEETGITVDKRRFRANVYLDLTSSDGFAEDAFVGRSMRIGSKVVVSVLERDPRCMMITLDPDTAEKSPAILKAVAQAHSGMAGVYGAVLVEGMMHKGDPVELLD